MKNIKNVRPGILVIPDAGLRLAPGETVSVETLSAQTEKALKRGFLVNVGASVSKKSLSDDSEQEGNFKEADNKFRDLNPKEAVVEVKKEKDLKILEDALLTENRGNVNEAMNKRLGELTGGAK